MNIVAHNQNSFEFCLNLEELGLIGNALNEVCNGVHIDDLEFQTRLGADRSVMRELLKQISDAYRSVARN